MFGTWEHLLDDDGIHPILLDEWRTNVEEKKNNGFNPSLRHIEFILEDGYKLYTFIQIARDPAANVPKVKRFRRELEEKRLVQIGADYFAADLEKNSEPLPPIKYHANFDEGRAFEVLQTVYERSADARQVCLEKYGRKCSVCDFDFDETFGEIANGFIHVHHLIEVSARKTAYQVDPLNDLRPLCPNCHAMIHKKRPPYTIEELKIIRNNVT